MASESETQKKAGEEAGKGDDDNQAMKEEVLSEQGEQVDVEAEDDDHREGQADEDWER